LTDNTKDSVASESVETGSVAKTCKILHLLGQRRTPLRLTDIARLTGINKATSYRILKCLVAYKMVGRTLRSEYVGVMRNRQGAPSVKIGYAAQTDEFAFSRAVTKSIEASATRAGIELVMLNNAYSPTVALQNAEALIKQNVHLIIEFQTDASIAALISAKLQARHVPMIAIEIPHPNAVYFGINNIQAGLSAGRHLARWAAEHWQGNVDMLVLLGLPMAGSLPGSRLTGSLLGLREIMPDFDDGKVKILNGDGRHEQSFETIRRLLQENKAKRILVSAINDPSALGALEAFRSCGREVSCAVMGQNASSEAVEEMRSSTTRLIGSVGYFPEKYGEQVIKLAIDMLEGKQTPSAVFVKHHLITPGNVQSYYPSTPKKRVAGSRRNV
jgi:ribose transport system substrate-binding protein